MKWQGESELDRFSHGCGWHACENSFRGEMPRGWMWLLGYWAKLPEMEFWRIPANDMSCDVCLCPEHVRALDEKLKLREFREAIEQMEESERARLEEIIRREC